MAAPALTATFAAASLLLACGAGLLASLLVAPVRGVRRALVMLALSGSALALGLAMMGGLPDAAAALGP